MTNIPFDHNLAIQGHYPKIINQVDIDTIQNLLEEIKKMNNQGTNQIKIKKCYKDQTNSKLVFELENIVL